MGTDWGRRAGTMLDTLARCSAPGPGVTRLPFTPEHRAALDHLSEWMRKAGLRVGLDDAGTLVGRLDGPEGSGTFYLGSHQDSVREGGSFDGIMGIVLPILALERLRAENRRLPFSVEILAFADEEGVRFPTALVGSRAIAGTFDPRVLSLKDGDGHSLGDVMTAFGLDVGRIPGIRRSGREALGFLETHIEQGPVLDRSGEPLGVVSAICGIERHLVSIAGETGHAGTVPMEGRRDALLAAADLIAAVNAAATARDDVRATVGALEVRPNVVNAIPGRVTLTVEIRAADDHSRGEAVAAFETAVREVAANRRVDIRTRKTYAQAAVACSSGLSGRLRDAVAEVLGREPRILPSGATHDASAMADLCPVAMLFVRCREGISHRPEEAVLAQDLGIAVAAVSRFLAGHPGTPVRNSG